MCIRDRFSNSVLIFEKKMLNLERAFIKNENIKDGSVMEMSNKGDGGISIAFFSEIFETKDFGLEEIIEFAKKKNLEAQKSNSLIDVESKVNDIVNKTRAIRKKKFNVKESDKLDPKFLALSLWTTNLFYAHLN